jgi:hypothetical protein
VWGERAHSVVANSGCERIVVRQGPGPPEWVDPDFALLEAGDNAGLRRAGPEGETAIARVRERTETTPIRRYGEGTPFADLLLVGPRSASRAMPDGVLRGFGGDDHIEGAASDDALDGGPGADAVFGRRGDDALAGGEGDDLLEGGRGRDVLDGGEGDDRLLGGFDADRLRGGPGNDAIRATDGRRDVVDCGPGRDRAILDRRDVATGCERRR